MRGKRKGYELKRDSRLRVYLAGGFSGGLVAPPAEVTLDRLSDRDFETVRDIVGKLQDRKARLEYADWLGDFGYYVEAGDKDADPRKLTSIFNGGPFSRTPVIVEQLSRLLKKAQKPSGPR